MTFVERDQFVRYNRLHERIMNMEGTSKIDYTTIKVASMSQSGINKLERVKKKVERNMQAICVIGGGKNVEKEDVEVLRNFYQQAKRTIRDIEEAQNTISLFIYSKMQAQEWLEYQGENNA